MNVLKNKWLPRGSIYFQNNKHFCYILIQNCVAQSDREKNYINSSQWTSIKTTHKTHVHNFSGKAEKPPHTGDQDATPKHSGIMDWIQKQKKDTSGTLTNVNFLVLISASWVIYIDNIRAGCGGTCHPEGQSQKESRLDDTREFRASVSCIVKACFRSNRYTAKVREG